MGFIKNSRMIERQIRGERVLVPLPGSEEALDSIYVLNETAGLVWDEAGKGRSEAEIAAKLSNEFAVSSEQALEDTKNLLCELREIGALHLAEEHDR